MKYSIYYPTPLEKIQNIKNDNIDVCVRTADREYTFVVATIENLRQPCWLDPRGFVAPCAPILIVDSLKKEVIEKLIDELCKDERLLEIYGRDTLL